MNRRASHTLAFAVLYLACLLPGGSLAQARQTSSSAMVDGRVEPQVLAQLDAQGTAGYLIYLNERPDLSPAYQMNWVERGRFVVKTLRGAADRSQAAVRTYLDARGIQYETFWIENVIAVESSSRATLEGLLQLPEVKAVRARRHPILYEPVESSPADMAPTSVQPNLTHVGADQVWAMGYTGQGVVVASIDTGVRYTHESLLPHYRGNDGDHNYDWWDPYGDHPAAPADDHGHGTHTMGIMVGEDASQGHQIGMAPDAQWIACRGCNSSSCTDVALLECAEFVVEPWDLSGAHGNSDLRPNVVNNSWGSCDGVYDGWYQDAVDAWQAAGIYPVFSNGNAGNSGCPFLPACNTVGNPGRYGNVTGVGSTGQSDGALAWYSLWGPTDSLDTINPNGYPSLKPQILAPGAMIYSSINTGDAAYGWKSGTSMSAPAVSGLVALMWSACPSLAGDYFNTESIIQDTATPMPYASNCGGEGPGNVPNMATGWGEINALAAVQMALSRCSSLGYLQGTVTGGTPSVPVENGLVTATREGGGSWKQTTDAGGTYSMTVPEGTFSVTVEHPEYTGMTATGLAIVAGSTTTQDFHLQHKGWLKGYVLDADSGAPLEATLSSSDGTHTTTDPATGYYEMILDAGVYQVTAEATDYASQSESIQVTAALTTVQDFLLKAAIAVVPEPIAVALDLDQEGSATAVMTNNLAVSYAFQFVEMAGDLPLSQSWSGVLPDAFGYTYSDSTQTDSVHYDWIDATDGTELILGDDDAANVTLPFAFDFYDTSSTKLRVGNNGAVLFATDSGSVPPNNQDLSTASTDDLIAPFWDDVDTGTGGVYYETVGTAPDRRFVVEWYDRPHFLGVESATFELILYEGSHNIKFQYQDVAFDNPDYDYGASATVGIRQSGSNYLQVAYDSAVLDDGMAICLRYPGALPCDAGDVPWYGTSLQTGTLLPGDSLVWTNYFTATAAAGIDQPGEYHAWLVAVPAGTDSDALPGKEIPVVLTVLPPPNMGKLEGLVTSDRPGGPLAAEMLIEAGDGLSYTIATDPDGLYFRWLPVGQYTVTATADGYLPASAQIEIITTATTNRNFELVRDAPEIAMAPRAFARTLGWGETATHTLSISNTGVASLTFELRTEAPWLSARPGAGTLLPDHSVPVTLTFDASRAPSPGIYETGLYADSNDPYEPTVHASVTLTVLADTYAGTLQGMVFSAGGCEGGSSPLGATVAVESTVGDTWTVDSDPLTGDYAQWLLPGVYTVTASTPYYEAQVATIQIRAQQTTTQDFVLPWSGPCMAVTPQTFTARVAQDSQLTQSLSIGNDGAGDLTWEIRETTGAVVDGAQGGQDGAGLAEDPDSLWIDTPWVSEVPTRGVTPAGSVSHVDVVFDATSLTAGACYTASLGLLHDDPGRETPLMIPVHLCVTPPWQGAYLPLIVRSAMP